MCVLFFIFFYYFVYLTSNFNKLFHNFAVLFLSVCVSLVLLFIFILALN